MQRKIVGYDIDETGDRIAILECGHPQHIRHQPPFINRPWTQTEAGRRSKLGAPLECVRCDEERAHEPSWSSLELGDGMMAGSRIAEIEEQFLPAFTAAGKPADMAVFKRHDTEHSLHCEVTAWFSPAAAAIGQSLGASPCIRPRRTSLELLAGDTGCWEVLFGSD